ncbi:MAG: tRNA (adenosine(37)-N6)-threonylcarbamoyltransferase complex ATPase subunit type 1 TsaE [Gemmatimonadetes bacterium]|nr:tRNA (adenosine(37)-N6)-threonylcarbamoyltransferase complex ATPase subunit type 1 TsaE [Gemmatimonadota bacterium]
MTEATLDEAGLVEWGRRLGASAARDRVFVALIGALGAGKTTLTRAACEGAGVRDDVTSPTYTLVHWYRGATGPIAHVDLYRIDDPRELDPLDWDELASGGCAVFVEWADRAGPALPPDRWELRLAIDPDPTRRRVSPRSLGDAPPIPEPVDARSAGAC